MCLWDKRPIALSILAVTLALVGQSIQAAPEEISWPDPAWVVSDPFSEGLDSAALGKLDEEIRSGLHGNIDSMLIIRNGRIVHDANYVRDYSHQHTDLEYPSDPPWDYLNTSKYPWFENSGLHTLQSVTKSVMSSLIGIAIERGDILGTSMTLAEILPHRNIKDPEIAAIRLENILKMAAGIDWEEDISYFDSKNDATASELTDDWVGYLLKKPMAAEQGTLFDYNSASSQILSEALSVSSGVPTNIYAERHLFKPIGITDYHWNSAPEGYANAGGGLFLSPHDLARFALLFEREGEWNGRQIVPRDWVALSTNSWISVSSEDPEDGIGYGYQWWIYRSARSGGPKMYGGWGWGGQFPLVVPELNLIGVFTGWNIREDVDYEYAFNLFYDRIVIGAR